MNLDEIAKKTTDKIEKERLITFLGTFIIGLCAHMFAMTHNLLTFDSMWNIYSDQDMISSGRQFLTYACLPSSFYALPWVTGLLAVFFLSIAAVLVCESLEIKGKVLCILTGGLLVTFPSVASTFAYSYTIDGYMLAVILSVLAFLFTYKKRLGFIPGILCMCVSLGIYQAYFSFTILLCIFSILLMILRDIDFKTILNRTLRMMIMGVGGYVFYVLTLKLMLAIKGSEISGYQGTDRLMSFSLSTIPQGFKSAWNNFYYFLRYGGVFSSAPGMKLFYLLFMALGVLLFAVLYVKRKCFKKIWTIPVILVLAMAIPFATCLISILSPDATFHLLMRFPWVAIMVFVVALIEEAQKEEWKLLNGLFGYVPVATAICGIIVTFTFIVSSNIVYFNLNERYEKTYGLCVRIVDHIENSAEYEPGMPVAILGGFPSSDYYPSTDITTDDLAGYFGVEGDLVVNSSKSYQSFCSHYLGFTFNVLDISEDENLAATEEYMEMKKFPYDGCVRVINGVLVIKLNG